MMKKSIYQYYLLTLTVVLMGLSSFSYAENNPSIRLMTEILPPFQYEDDNKTIGISIDIVNAIQKGMNTDYPIKVYPWSRGLKITNKKANSALFSMLRTPEREKLYKWVGPLTSMQMVFFKKKGSPIQLTSLEDAKKVNKVGVTKNVGNHQMMKAKGFTNLDIITSGADEKNIKKLVKGRIDLWPSLKMTGFYNARKMGLGDEIVAINNVVAFSGDLYIAFNIKTDDSIIERWQNSLDKLVKAGEIDRILRNYN